MSLSNLVIGLGGVAQSGKDTFFNIFKKVMESSSGYRVTRYALADFLKETANLWTKQAYNIDCLNASPEEKALIRDFLVFHGKVMRIKTNGRHWINHLNNYILTNAVNDGEGHICVITDIRYDEYEKDEVYWLKKELAGYLLHISMYEFQEDENGVIKKSFKQPPNQAELENNPKIKSAADYVLQWECVKSDSQDELFNKLSPNVNEVIENLFQNRWLT